MKQNNDIKENNNQISFKDDVSIVKNITEILNNTTRALGLSQENYKLYDMVYNGDIMTEAKIRTYPGAEALDGDTNPTAQYQISSQYDQQNRWIMYKVEKI